MQPYLWIQRALVAAVIAGASAAQAGVHVSLVPSSAQVAPGAEFEVRLRVTQEGDAFNAYSAVLSFDPAAMTFIPMPATTQEGAYMALACGSSSHSCIPSPGQLSISHTLLCLGLSLTGPGDLYVLRFQAANMPQTAALHFSSVQFYYAGRFTAMSEAIDATIQIGSPGGHRRAVGRRRAGIARIAESVLRGHRAARRGARTHCQCRGVRRTRTCGAVACAGATPRRPRHTGVERPG